MKIRAHRFILLTLLCALQGAAQAAAPGRFDPAKDLFLPQFDSRTDVDDLHSVAGVATLLANPALKGVRVHAVAGAYGTQEGAYVPAPGLFELAFRGRWSDAHDQYEAALDEVTALVADTLRSGGSVWVAEAGQSDFTADWLERVEGMDLPVRNVHVVQHSDWNEEVTTPARLAYVRETANYHRIPDGNGAGNGTPNFRTFSGDVWPRAEAHPRAGEAWRVARALADRYNGRQGRYLNEAIAAGGMDFSDVVESCWIFGCVDLADVAAFFEVHPGSR